MQLAILLVVVCAVSSIPGEGQLGAEILWQLPAAFVLLAVGPAAAVIARWSLQAALGLGLPLRQVQRRWEAWYESIAWLWAVSSLAVLYLGRWPQVVRSLPVTLTWPLVDDLLILFPLVLSLLLVWLACHRVERWLQTVTGELTLARWTYVTLRVRHHLGLVLLPALAILGVQETAVWLNWTSGADDQRAWWLWGVLLAAAVFGLPMLLKWLWQAKQVADSPLKARLQASCRALGCGVRDIVVWRTGGTLANAAVAGLLPGMRTIFLSDGLIARLTDDELDVVVRHEAAHLARRHGWQRMMLLAAPILIYLAVHAQFPAAPAAVSEYISYVGIAPVWQMTLLLPLGVMTYALVSMGIVARMHEHDADLAACSAGGGEVAPESIVDLHSALVKLVGDGPEYDRQRWLHPSVIERIAFLQRASHQPQLAARFRWRLGSLSSLLVLLCAAAAAAGLWQLPL